MSIELKYSIIIPTYNRSKTLALTLGSVCNQTLPPKEYEILTVDDGSTDNTKEVVSSFQKKYPNSNIRYFYEQNGGPAKARNLGIKESKGEIIFFTDDDCIVPKNWIETLLDGYRRHPEVVGIGGGYKSFNKSSDRYFQKYIDKYTIFGDNDRNNYMFELENKTNIFGSSSSGITANMSYKKEILEEVGGFDENLYFAGAVDLELKRNILGRRHYILYVPFMVEHLKNFNFINFFKKSFNQGRGRYYMFLKYPGLPSHYNFNFINFFKKILFYDYKDMEFFPAYFTVIFSLFIGRCYAKYIKPFKNVKSVRKFKKPNIEIFSVEKRNIKSNTVVSTKFLNFNKYSVLNAEIKSNHEFFSIIIPTYNRSKTLALTLGSVCNQTLPPKEYEILTVDDGSTDNTKEVVSSFQKKYPNSNIRYFYEQNGGPAKARNLGIKESKGEIIFFTDDDCIVPKNWIETLLDGYRRHPEVVGVGGWHIPPEGETKGSAISRYINFTSFFSRPFLNFFLRDYEIISNNPRLCFGAFAYNTANVCYRRKILEEVNGFSEYFYWPGGEDNDLALRIMIAGYKILYLPFHVIHPKDMMIINFCKMYFKQGANGYLLRHVNHLFLEESNPGFVGKYGSVSNFLTRFFGPGKIIAFFEWLSLNAGIIYMKNELSKRNNPILSEPKKKVGNG